jgi:2-dehydropantoate 2-reductase
VTPRTIWIAGAGAIGCVLAGTLRVDEPPRLIDSWPEHIERIRSVGLRIDYPAGAVEVRLPISHLDEVDDLDERPDVVLLAVKSPSTVEFVKRLLPRLHDTSTIVSLQNGVNEEIISSLAGPQRTMGAVVDYGGELLAAGRARGYSLESGIVVGELDGSITPRLRSLVAMLDGEIPVSATENIWGELWSKLVVNVQVNALSAVTGFPTDRIAADPVTRRIAIALATEAIRVAETLGLELDGAFLDGHPSAYANARSPNDFRRIEERFVDRWKDVSVKPSMLQDLEKRRPTEIDALNGYVVEKARALDVPAPVNAAVVRLAKAAESAVSLRDWRGGAHEELRRLYDDLQ